MSTASLPALRSQSAGLPAQADLMRSIEDVFRMGDILLRSGMLPSAIRSPEAAVTIILKGRELGIPPLEAFAGITVIQGKPTVSPQLMLSLIFRSGQIVGVPRIEDDGTTCTVTMTRKGGEPHSESFGVAEAKGLGLSGKDNWIKQPKTMRKWRAIAACARIVFPDVIGGMYLHEELGGQVNEEGEIIDGAPIDPPAPPQKAIPQNNSGHGKGMYASPDQTKEFAEKFDAWLAEQNAKWLDTFSDEFGEVYPDVKELMTSWQARGHMLKWCVTTERLDPAIVPENVKNRQLDPFLAIVYYRDRKPFGQEMLRYVEQTKVEREDAYYRKHPEHAPPEWLERQQHPDEPEVAEEKPAKAKRETKKELAEKLRQQAEAAKEPEVIDVESEPAEAWPAGRE